MANKNTPATKVVIPCRISFANIWEPRSVNGSEEKYSVSCLIPKSDKTTLTKIHKAIEAAKEAAQSKRWGGKIPANLKLPLHDGDTERADDENYEGMRRFLILDTGNEKQEGSDKLEAPDEPLLKTEEERLAELERRMEEQESRLANLETRMGRLETD